MKIRFKNGIELKVASAKKEIDHNAYFNNRLNNTIVVINVSENPTVTVERLKELLTPEAVSEIIFLREGGEDIKDSFVRFAKITQSIDDYGNQIIIILSKDPYIADPTTVAEV